MEAIRPVGGRTIQRKPLADCTNTVSRPTQQKPPSLVKFANPSLTSSLKRLVDQTTLKEKPKDVSNSKSNDENASKSVAAKKRPVTRRMSADLVFPATAPPKPRSDRGASEKEVAEPYSVYTAKRKRRSKETSSSAAVPRLRLDLMPSSGKKTHQANEKKSTPLKATPKKRKRTVKHEQDNLVRGVPKDYIEKQRAYFAEIDAFELQEEEVSSSDLD